MVVQDFTSYDAGFHQNGRGMNEGEYVIWLVPQLCTFVSIQCLQLGKHRSSAVAHIHFCFGIISKYIFYQVLVSEIELKI